MRGQNVLRGAPGPGSWPRDNGVPPSPARHAADRIRSTDSCRHTIGSRGPEQIRGHARRRWTSVRWHSGVVLAGWSNSPADPTRIRRKLPGHCCNGRGILAQHAKTALAAIQPPSVQFRPAPRTHVPSRSHVFPKRRFFAWCRRTVESRHASVHPISGHSPARRSQLPARGRYVAGSLPAA